MMIELPDDFRKIINELRKGPVDIQALRKATGIDERKLREILMRMKALNMVSFIPGYDDIALAEKTYIPRRLLK
jgi:predicted Rossmann fold nucleotide-binding protein DprA/Smf involved in DNA uptake